MLQDGCVRWHQPAGLMLLSLVYHALPAKGRLGVAAALLALPAWVSSARWRCPSRSLLACGTLYTKKSLSASGKCHRAASALISTPSPGRSQTSMKPSLTIGLGRPSTISYHQSGLPVGYSKAI